MNHLHRSSFHKKIRLPFHSLEFLWIGTILLLSLSIRLIILPVETSDYVQFLHPWMNQFEQHGGIAALKYSFANYNIPYLFLMALLSYLPLKDLIAIKLLSVAFDYLMAFFIMKLLYEETKNTKRAILGFSITLFAPTILINSAGWAQCDILYSYFLLLSLYYLTKRKEYSCILCFAISFSFKLQAIFLAPVLFLFALKKQLRIRCFWIIPLWYGISVLPALLVGRSLTDILSIYFTQTTTYADLTMNYPNLFALIGIQYSDFLAHMGILLTAILLFILLSLFYYKQIPMDLQTVLPISMLFLSSVLFTLPHMHERYGFLLDVMAILYACLNWGNLRKTMVAMGFHIVSLLSYLCFFYRLDSWVLQATTILLVVCILNLWNEVNLSLGENLNTSRPFAFLRRYLLKND